MNVKIYDSSIGWGLVDFFLHRVVNWALQILKSEEMWFILPMNHMNSNPYTCKVNHPKPTPIAKPTLCITCIHYVFQMYACGT